MALPRPHMSLSVKLAACLDALGYEPGDAKYLWGVGWTLGEKIAQCLEWLGFEPDDEIEWDHQPALVLRKRTADGGYDPPANDPRYIRPMRKADHKVKTIGRGATTAGSDVGNARHLGDLIESHAGHERRMAGKQCGKPRERTGTIPSRPFDKRPRPMRKEMNR